MKHVPRSLARQFLRVCRSVTWWVTHGEWYEFGLWPVSWWISPTARRVACRTWRARSRHLRTHDRASDRAESTAPRRRLWNPLAAAPTSSSHHGRRRRPAPTSSSHHWWPARRLLAVVGCSVVRAHPWWCRWLLVPSSPPRRNPPTAPAAASRRPRASVSCCSTCHTWYESARARTVRCDRRRRSTSVASTFYEACAVTMRTCRPASVQLLSHKIRAPSAFSSTWCSPARRADSIRQIRRVEKHPSCTSRDMTPLALVRCSHTQRHNHSETPRRGRAIRVNRARTRSCDGTSHRLRSRVLTRTSQTSCASPREQSSEFRTRSPSPIRAPSWTERHLNGARYHVSPPPRGSPAWRDIRHAMRARRPVLCTARVSARLSEPSTGRRREAAGARSTWRPRLRPLGRIFLSYILESFPDVILVQTVKWIVAFDWLLQPCLLPLFLFYDNMFCLTTGLPQDVSVHDGGVHKSPEKVLPPSPPWMPNRHHPSSTLGRSSSASAPELALEGAVAPSLSFSE